MLKVLEQRPDRDAAIGCCRSLRHARRRTTRRSVLRRRSPRVWAAPDESARRRLRGTDRQAGVLTLDCRWTTAVRRRHRCRQRDRAPHQGAGARTYTPGVLSGIGSFGGLFALDRGCRSRCWSSSADGVGTKLKVAFMTGIHDTIGADLVNHCVNDILVQGASRCSFSTTSRPGVCRRTSPSRSSTGWRSLPRQRVRAARR